MASYIYAINRFEEARDWLEDGAARADRDLNEIDVAMYLLTAVGDDRAEARRVAAAHLVKYFRGDIPGYYERVAREGGFEADVEAAAAADTDAEAAEALSDEFVESVSVVETETDVRSQIDDLRNIGLQLPIIRPPMTDEGVIERTMQALAPNRNDS